ncbi:Retrovirus-related Pol polyprotein from transposon opus [Gossypium australe]|uniref:Retrovirus-related Pol polyprotein from transposon opus n=1 Tax=Gossypium australe TaxID=47621 RepID=A0A5B6WSP8_9ROSI|nr:Retrovirus-related Pol polyprotein from transposon opus [Gossypium australe]
MMAWRATKTERPREFYYSHKIRSIHFSIALCDLRASINLKPLSIFEELGTSYVLVKVRSFIIRANFVVLDFEENREIPVLLGRPFLATSRSTIDLEKNELTMKIIGKKYSNAAINLVKRKV